MKMDQLEYFVKAMNMVEESLKPKKTQSKCPFHAMPNDMGIDKEYCLILDLPCTKEDWLKCNTAKWELDNRKPIRED